MASSALLTARKAVDQDEPPAAGETESTWQLVREVLQRLASLKITVTVLVMAMFLVVAGTLAQVDKDVWQVVDEYFRAPLAWIDLKVFVPPSFFPGLAVPNQVLLPGGFVVALGFYFPGGWLIGGLLTVNLLAASVVRFPVQARGRRLRVGWVVVGLGCLLTWLVIASGAAADGEQMGLSIPRVVAWRLIQTGLAIGGLLLGIAAVRLARSRSLERSTLLGGAVLLAGILAWTLWGGSAARLGDSSLRILWQMCKAQLATLVLLVGCAILYKKKAGLVLLHGGIGLMMFGTLLTGLTAVEGHMQMFEGQTTSFVRHLRSLELAVVDRSDPERDVVVTVPEAQFLSGQVIHHGDLPFDIRLVHFLKNSAVRAVRPGEPNPATAGIGLTWLAEPSRPVSGTDGGKANMSAAYVSFLRKDSSEDLGTHLVGLSFSEEGLTEEVEAGGKTYDVSLRHARTYKPYALKLIDVQKEDYPGTDIPRHYASLVRLTDDSRHVDRTIKIWMNNPLRFAGETFYQSGYYRDPQSGAEGTTLAVVSNTGWMIPYVACMLVATGLVTHFMVVLGRFLKRRSERSTAETPVPRGRPTERAEPSRLGWASIAAKLVVPAAVIVSGAWLIGKARPPAAPSGGFGFYEFGKLPVVDHGRAKPVDSLARTCLQILSARQSFLDSHGERQPAIRWFLDLVARPDAAAEHAVFRLENTEVLSTLGLTAREGFRYSYREIAARHGALKEQVDLALTVEPSRLSIYQKKVLELDRKLALWNMLIHAFIPPGELRNRNWAVGLGQISAREPAPLCIPTGSDHKPWQTYVLGLARNSTQGESEDTVPGRATRAMTAILGAYSGDDALTFNREVGRFQAILRESPEADLDLTKVRYEAFYNHFDPCYHAAVLYVLAFVLAALAWLGWGRLLNRASFGVIVAAFCLHLFVLISRIYISGRPPVTNLYSSAIFIGWAAVLFGLGLELVYRMGIGNVIASVIGFATLLVAYFLGGDGDTFAVLQAVLDTQFWLATHVVCITLGYSATYVAGLLGILYVLRGVATPSLSRATGNELSRMIYGTLCFAILFSFVGTVLGGLWADDSWGRFWGWDPKENGALLIVLWNAMVLHARKGGLIKERGLAVLAVAGNIAVSWSWFGVNELGIGLHSYGFTEGALRALGLFVVSQLAIVALGLLPGSLWMSHCRRSLPGEA
jgi:ABC-type transport system involved in cytochrome c biogenesis permease subunit